MRANPYADDGIGKDTAETAAADNKRLLLETLKRTNRIIGSASQNDLAEALFIFALEVAHYRTRDGQHYETRAEALRAGTLLDEDQAAWVNEALQSIATTLALLANEGGSPGKGALH